HVTGVQTCALPIFPRASQVVLVGRRLEVLREAAQGLGAVAPTGVQVTPLACDLTVPHEVEKLAEVLHRGPSIDVLVCNAGGNVGMGAGPELASIAEGWRGDFDANVLSAVLLTSAVLDHVTRPGGRLGRASCRYRE